MPQSTHAVFSIFRRPLRLRQSGQPDPERRPPQRRTELRLRQTRPDSGSREQPDGPQREIRLRPGGQHPVGQPTGRSQVRPSENPGQPQPVRRQPAERTQRHRIHLRRTGQPDLPPVARRRKPILPIRHRKPTGPRRN